MNTKKIKWPPHIPEMGDLVKTYINRGKSLSIADKSGVYKELEDEFAKLHNKKYALLVSSGTMALYSAYFGINLLPGDEVICTAFSYHATAAPLLHFGVNIVFCDVEEDTGNIDTTKIKELITSKTKAIITNDQWGHPVDKDCIIKLCKEYNLKYIEDCSHAHFSEYKGKYVGTFGDVACWSFQGNKLLSGGEGGILLTDNQDIYERAVLLGHNLKRPFTEVKNPIYKNLLRTGFGLKLRIHPLAAVMILHQLRNYCFKWIKSRNENLEYFQSELVKFTPFQKMAKRDYVTSMGAWYGFKPRLNYKATGINRKNFVTNMQERGLEIKIPGSELMPAYSLFNSKNITLHNFQKKITCAEYPGAEKYIASIISIPTWTFPDDQKVIDEYISCFKSFFDKEL